MSIVVNSHGEGILEEVSRKRERGRRGGEKEREGVGGGEGVAGTIAGPTLGVVLM